MATTDTNGAATFTYTGVSTGTDVAVAFATVGGSTITSNVGTATWTEGKHSTFLSLCEHVAKGKPRDGAGGVPIEEAATLKLRQVFLETITRRHRAQVCERKRSPDHRGIREQIARRRG
jgi:hypothetical protein